MTHKKYLFLAASVAAFLAAPATAQVSDEYDYFSLSAEELFSATVTTATKTQEEWWTTPAAVYVISQEDIRRMGVTSIPEALRMVPGVEVARAASNRWAVSARGFNGVLASKLLVQIDGRTIYTPVFSGTYWDDQTTLLEDIDRIEVIRGPGAALYGANAVNGIINIITKHTANTQGNFVSAGFGNEEAHLKARRGGKIKDGTYYRTYAQFSDWDASHRLGGGENEDAWRQGRTGFRMDSEVNERDSFTLQGDAYLTRFDSEMNLFIPAAPFVENVTGRQTSYGGNVLGRWERQLSARANISLQGYLDHYMRDEIHFDQKVTTADLQFKHDIKVNDENRFIWGTGGRYTMMRNDETFNSGIWKEDINRHVLNLFFQNEFAFVPDEWILTLGSKLEHNNYTGFEIQPSAKLTWLATERQMLWASVSRAVRTPSEIEDQALATIGVLPGMPLQAFALTGNRDLEAEKLIAYELGHRVQFNPALSLDTALFYNDYEDLFAIGQFGAVPFVRRGVSFTPLPFVNLGEGETYGVELAAEWKVTPEWRLSASYSYLEIASKAGQGAIAPLYNEDSDPHHQFAFRSYLNLPHGVQWNNMVYYVDEALTPTDAYIRLDSRLAWQIRPGIEAGLIARDLLDKHHPEINAFPQAEMGRSIYGNITWRF